MNPKSPLLAAALAVALAFTSSGIAHADDKLSQNELRKLVPGRYAVNVMGLFDMTVAIRANGIIVGQAKGEKDRGFWTIQGEKLCIAWSKWQGGKTRCAALTGDNGSYRGGGLSIRRI